MTDAWILIQLAALLIYDVVGLVLIVWAMVYAIHLWRRGR